jgi:formylglycine-generating enzyme required for sulfatase activity
MRSCTLMVLLVLTAACESPPVRAPMSAAALAHDPMLTPRPVPQDYERPYGPDPFAPSEVRVEGGGLLAQGALANSVACGECHEQIFAQWQSSLHRAAGTDPFTRYAIDLMAENYGVASTRLCEACHEPGHLLAGLIDRAATPDRATRREGVSCLSCHLITSVHDANQRPTVANASFHVQRLPREVLFPDLSDDPEAERRHAEALRRPFLSSNRFCASCHRFYLPTALIGAPPGRLRLQAEEAEGTVFADPDSPDYQSCVDCHMPLMDGDDPAAPDGKIHDHRSLGSNAWIPALEGDAAQVEATDAFRRAGAVSMTIEALRRDERGELLLPVVLKNDKNGHDFPTGATDISEVWLELTLRGAGGKIVFQSPGLGEDGYLAPEAPSLNSLVTVPGGDLDFLHDMLNQVALRRHPRIRPGASRTLEVGVTLPDGAAPPLDAEVVLRARHGNQRWNDWTFNFEDVEIHVSELARVTRGLSSLPEAVTPPVVVAAPPPTPSEGMVFVPGGTYVIGADPRVDPEALTNEWPPHEVALTPFFLDRVPVTHAEYLVAVEAGVVEAPPEMKETGLQKISWRGGKPQPGLEDHPVVTVTREEASGYCASKGKRLPTEVEWEAAAAGSEKRRYAWGDTFDPALCNAIESGRMMTHPVGAIPGNASPFGALDMGCNVSEHVAGDYYAYPRVRHVDNRDDWALRLQDPSPAVSRGAPFDGVSGWARTSARVFCSADHRKLTGFRCALDAAPPSSEGAP